MSLLAPLYLAGIAALSLPLIFHLIRRTPRGRTTFSSLMFLRPTPPRLVRRSRLDDVALFSLRALILLLLALAFTRPFLRTEAVADAGAGEAARVAILVDTSASMRRPGLWEAAQREVQAALDEEGGTTVVSLHAFDRGLRELDPAEFEQLEPSWAATGLGDALIELADDLHAAGRGDSTIVLISDLQAGASRDALELRDWPGDVGVQVRAVRAAAGNAGLHAVPRAPQAAEADEAPLVRVTNDGEAGPEQFLLRWSDGVNVGEPMTLFCPHGETRVVRAPARPDEPRFDRLVLEGDGATFDDVLFDPRVPPRQHEVLSLAGPTLDEFLGFVFAPDAAAPVVLNAAQGWPAGGAEVERTPLVVCEASGAEASGNQAPVEALLEHARRGGVVLAVLSADGDDPAALRALLNEPALELAEAENERGYALLGEVDFEHPLLAPYDDPRFSDFTKIRFWHRRALDLAADGAEPDLHVLARYDDGQPFLVERVVGDGRVLVMTSTWLPADGDLARSTKFAPLLHGMLRLGRRPDPALASLYVGDALNIAPAEAGQERSVIGPDGRRHVLAPEATAFTATELPGVYQLARGDEQRAFAVQVDPAESRTDPMQDDPLARAGVRVSTRAEEAAGERRARQQSAAELEQGQQGWRWLILAVLAMLLLETVWAGRLARRTRLAETGPVGS